MSREYCEYIVDLLSSWDPVSVKAMFGGYGLYRRGQIFAIVAEDTLYFKVGETNRPDYEAAGSSPFVYDAKNKKIAMSYWRLPEEVLEDPEQIALWAEKAYEAALRGKSMKRRKSE